MILVVTGKDDATADYLCHRLAAEDIEFLRFDTDRDLADVTVGYAGAPFLTIDHRSFVPSDFKAVWYRRPTPLSPKIEGSPEELWQVAYEWSEAVEGFLAHIPISRWINHPSRNAVASHKMEQLTRARHFGFHVPQTIVTQSRDVLLDFWTTCNGRLVVKPLACGYIERATSHDDTQIYTCAVSESDLNDSAILRNCPTLLQERIDKSRDVRITVLDDHVTAVELVATDDDGCQRLDIRRNNMADVRYTLVDLPDSVRARLLSLLRSYELRFAAVDMAIDRAGNWVFFEINPNGQWAWTDIAGVSDIAADFVHAFFDCKELQ